MCQSRKNTFKQPVSSLLYAYTHCSSFFLFPFQQAMSNIEHYDFQLSPLHGKYFHFHLHSMPEPYIMFETATLTSVRLTQGSFAFPAFFFLSFFRSTFACMHWISWAN